MSISHLFTLSFIFLFASNTFAQNSKHVNYYKELPGVSIKSEAYNLSYDNVVAKMDYLKMAIEINNLTSDYLLIKKEEVEYELNGKTYTPAKKWIFIRPNKSIKRTFKIDGQTNYHVDKFKVTPYAIYTFKEGDNIHKAPNFNLPASTNQIKFDDFVVKLLKVKKKTKETVATFEVTYNGDAVALVNPGNLSVTIPDRGDNEFANDSKGAVRLLTKGEKKTMKAVFHIPASYSDMQFANMEIIWGETFQTSKPEKSVGISSEFVVDEGMTRAKNR